MREVLTISEKTLEGAADNLPTDSAGGRGLEVWEARLPEEPTKAFKAFCLFRAMGIHRSIKGCMELHGVEARKYGTWSRWARLYDWQDRAASYDEHLAKESQRQILAESVERKKRQIEILNEFDALVSKSVKALKPEDLDAEAAMDILERSAKLDGFITGQDSEKDKGQGSLQLTFASDFAGL